MSWRPETGSAATAEGQPGRAPLDLTRVPAGGLTRFAPAPTGYLHVGHLANAVYVWGVARATGGLVLLRIEDHDRQRCRPGYDAAILEDLTALAFVADAGPFRQADPEAVAAYEDALGRLRAAGLVYACDCTRSTFARWAAERGRAWMGPGCPSGCRERKVADDAGVGMRVDLADGEEAWSDLLLGERSDAVAPDGDLLVRDRHGNWTYGFAVVVDDLRQGVGLVIRGEDLASATARQIRLGRLLGRDEPPAWLHHPLIRKPDGSKLSKADRDTSIRELLPAGVSPAELIGRAAAAVGLAPEPVAIHADDVGWLFAGG